MKDEESDDRRRYEGKDLDADLVSTGLHGIQITDEGGEEEDYVTNVSGNSRIHAVELAKYAHRVVRQTVVEIKVEE